MIGDLEDMVIVDVMDDLVQPKGRYPESFVLISLLEVCKAWESLEYRVILEVLNDLVCTRGRYPESFALISLMEVCQEWGVKKGGTRRTLRVPDRRCGGLGHP